MSHLHETAKKLVAPGKGILAADERPSSMDKKLKTIDIEGTEDVRQAYRGMLFTSSNIEDYISGVIMSDETFRQATPDGISYPRLLESRGIIPGIKVDEGTQELDKYSNEKVTKGLADLPLRLPAYVTMGARFAKWRAVYTIMYSLPSKYIVEQNAKDLAAYAKACQEAGLVPIVEPEVLMDGDHDINRCYEVTKAAQQAVFEELENAQVDLKGILLKPNMVISGKDCTEQASAEEVADYTIRCFQETVPEEVAGIVFLSGGQSEEQAVANLNAINQSTLDRPWPLSFSYGRALQQSTLKIWSGDSENIQAAQQAFLEQAKRCSLARDGRLV